VSASLRAFANCIGITGPFSVLGDFFGFRERRLPTDPTGKRVEVSLIQQINSLRGRHFDLNIIKVGSDQFTASDHNEIDYSIFKLRNVYRPANLGVGRIRHWVISTADANGLDSPTTVGDLDDLTAAWTVPNTAIDLFIPHNMNVASNSGVVLGKSAIKGPCDKDDATADMTGSTAGLWGSEQTARTIAHELGHYLGLQHNHMNQCPTTTAGKNNLMAQSRCALSTRNSTLLTSSQGTDMRGHCSTRGGC
jgi:reprolysin-like metallo-peptidase family M12B